MKQTGRFERPRSKNNTAKIIGVILLLCVLGFTLVLGRKLLPINTESTEIPPRKIGVKSPESYTWEEYMALEDTQKDAFFESFESADAFDAWLVAVGAPVAQESRAIDKPWEQGGKDPASYTWEEFLALSPELQEAFFEEFDSTEAFDMWKRNAGGPTETTESINAAPWEQGGKQPCEYTWDEYQNLPDELKDAFFESFDSQDDFTNWLYQVNQTVLTEDAATEEISTQTQPQDTGAKHNYEYTWEEFLALSPEEQEEFFQSFPSPDLFEKWMTDALANSSTD